jgi:hypothetical protein
MNSTSNAKLAQVFLHQSQLLKVIIVFVVHIYGTLLLECPQHSRGDFQRRSVKEAKRSHIGLFLLSKVF